MKKNLDFIKSNIKLCNNYLEKKCQPNDLKINKIINDIDDIFLKIDPSHKQIYLYKHIDLIFNKNKHKSQFLNNKGFYPGFILTNLYPGNYLNENENIILKLNIPIGSKCMLLDDNKVLLNRNCIISIKTIKYNIININYYNIKD